MIVATAQHTNTIQVRPALALHENAGDDTNGAIAASSEQMALATPLTRPERDAPADVFISTLADVKQNELDADDSSDTSTMPGQITSGWPAEIGPSAGHIAIVGA